MQSEGLAAKLYEDTASRQNKAMRQISEKHKKENKLTLFRDLNAERRLETEGVCRYVEEARQSYAPNIGKAQKGE